MTLKQSHEAGLVLPNSVRHPARLQRQLSGPLVIDFQNVSTFSAAAAAEIFVGE